MTIDTEPRCTGGKLHSAVLTAEDDPERYDQSVLNPVPNGHQYGYCEDCHCPFRWDVRRQSWVYWPEGKKESDGQST